MFAWSRAYVGPLWAMSAPYWAHAGPSWAILGYVSAFVLDLGISVSLNFRPRNGFEKNTINTKEETPYWAHVELSWAILGSVSAFVLDLGISVWLNFRPCNAAMLAWSRAYVGPLWAMSAPYWAHVEPFWWIVWFVLAFVGSLLPGIFWYIWMLSVVCRAGLQNRRVQFWLRRPRFCQCFLGCWASVGTILGSCSAILRVFCGLCWPLLGKSWDHIGFILGHFGLCWDILGHVGTILGSCWAILGYFRICGLCFGLGHFNVVEFSSMQGVCKKHPKYQEKIRPHRFGGEGVLIGGQQQH